jgi:putative transposase
MPRKRLTEEQIMRLLHDAEIVGTVRDGCRPQNIAEPTLSRWRRQLGGMDVAEAKRRRALERENAELKRRVGDLRLDHRMLQDGLEKTWSAARPGVVWQPSWSRPMGPVNGAGVGCWIGTAVPNAGSQGPWNRGRCWLACTPSRSGIPGWGSARCSPG